jgi:DME family drug/metabolite transporter
VDLARRSPANVATTVPVPATRASQTRGLLLALAATIAWSSAGLFVRLVESGTSWHIILYRSMGLTVALAAMIAVIHRGQAGAALRSAGWTAVLAGACSCASSALFILALGQVTVANALFVSGIAPFLAALGGRIVLGERVGRHTWGAMVLAAGGVALMLGQGLAIGRLAGNLLALGSALSFAVYGVLVRGNRQTDMLPAVLYSGLYGCLLGLAVQLATGGPGAPLDRLGLPLRDAGLSFAMGVTQLALGMAFYTRASRHLPAAELQLLATTELVLAPLWVWFGVGEVPTLTTLAGGALVFLAVLAQALVARRHRPTVGAGVGDRR